MNKKNFKKTPYEIKENTAYFVKNRLPAFILAFLIVFWTVASVFGFIAFGRSKKSAHADIITVSADSTNSYHTTLFRVPLRGLTGLYEVDTATQLQNEYTLVFSENSVFLETYHTDGGAISVEVVDSVENTLVVYYRYENLSGWLSHEGNMYVEGSEWNYNISANYQFYYPYTVEYQVDESASGLNLICNTTFRYVYNGEIVGTTVHSCYITPSFPQQSSYWDYVLPSFDLLYEYQQSGIRTLYTDFIDQNGGEALLIYERNYYESLSNDNDIAVQGAYNEGYAVGKKEGYSNGYEVGVVAGASSANEYTFDGLLSAVFDVPVRTFTSLFNFDLLGINLANFFLSLLTLAIIIAVVRRLI